MLLTLLQHHQLGAQIQDGLLGRVLGLGGAASKPTPHLERYVMVLKVETRRRFLGAVAENFVPGYRSRDGFGRSEVDGGVIPNKTNDSIARWK